MALQNQGKPLPSSFYLPETRPKATLLTTGGTLLSGPPISIIKATECLIIQLATRPSESSLLEGNRIFQAFPKSTQLSWRSRNSSVIGPNGT
jgi:hypothetical protein